MREKLILLRTTNDISTKQMAKLIGITPKQYLIKEKGKARFYIDECKKISDYFKVSIEDIFLDNTHQKVAFKKGDKYDES